MSVQFRSSVNLCLRKEEERGSCRVNRIIDVHDSIFGKSRSWSGAKSD
jgi:hypothetical protein